MQRLLVVAVSVLGVAGTALADVSSSGPLQAPAPTPRTCKPTGSPIFEIDLRIDGDKPVVASMTKVYANGAWTKQRIATQTRPNTSDEGCLEQHTIDAIRARLKEMPWHKIHNRFTCQAYSPRHTVYRVDGKHVYDARLCGAESLDPKSDAELAEIQKLLEVLPADDSSDSVEQETGKPATGQPESSTGRRGQAAGNQ
jgi:hypothetical protein